MTEKSIYSRIQDALKKTTVEPYMFLVMFAFNARLVTLQSLLHDRACRVVLNFSSETCDGLEDENNNKEQLLAISYGNDIYTGTVLMSTIPALVIASFLGPWSDRYSRKYPLLMATTGILIDSILQTIITSFSNASPYWFIVSSAVSGFSGGLVIVISSTYSYMSDITDERSRNVRFAILEFFTIMATPTGSLVGGQVYDKYGYLPVMLIVPCSLTLALLWVRLYILETKPKRFDITKKEMFMDVLRYDNMKKSFKTCIKERPGNLRMQIWLLLFTSFSLRLIHMGSVAIGFSYTRKVFKWKVTRYSYTTATFSLLNAAATLAIVPFLNRKLLVHEAAVGLVGVLSLMARMTLMSVAITEGLIFYAWSSGALFACGGIAIRSRISKLVSRKELGRVFSLLATCESLTPVLGTIIMIQLYDWSAQFYPGLPFAAAAIFLIPAAGIFAWMMSLPTLSVTQYEENEQAKKMKELKDVSSGSFKY